jgi:hypothetical protein
MLPLSTGLVCQECAMHQARQLRLLKHGPCEVCQKPFRRLLRGKPRLCSICYLVCCAKCKRTTLVHDPKWKRVCRDCLSQAQEFDRDAARRSHYVRLVRVIMMMTMTTTTTTMMVTMTTTTTTMMVTMTTTATKTLTT